MLCTTTVSPLRHKREQLRQLRPLHIFPGRHIGKEAVHRHALQLTGELLIPTADAHISDPMTRNETASFADKVSGRSP